MLDGAVGLDVLFVKNKGKKKGTGSFPGVKQLGHGRNHPTLSSAEVRKE
jgi:hypothetical protein